MKKILLVATSFLLIFSLVGCANSKKQEALLKYINEDLPELSAIETELLNSYNSVLGDNYTNDLTVYNEFSNNTIDLAKDLNAKATNLLQEIDDEEILEVHRIYMNYAAKYLDAVNMILSAVETGDRTQTTTANEKVNEANNLALDFRSKLKSLADANGIIFEE